MMIQLGNHHLNADDMFSLKMQQKYVGGTDIFYRRMEIIEATNVGLEK